MDRDESKNGEPASWARADSLEARPRSSWNGTTPVQAMTSEMDSLQVFSDERQTVSSSSSMNNVPKWFDSMVKCERTSRSSSQERASMRTAEPAPRVLDLDLAGPGRLRTSSGCDSSSGRLNSPKVIPEDWLDTLPSQPPISPMASSPGLTGGAGRMTSLEESWGHLQAFNRQQRGRISSVQLDTADVMHMYMPTKDR
ncbi:uncharacterized protein LOC119095724 [Pollicipes pollicipes]|uniref:uncharacterized protein LOC119095724 n=1 Tax=Pollicipes pollicipes TaxID=41117 RepID=UPI0018851FC6|nr:uncharacterized protein LOC119095724 [Pollicipes pollicipes]